MNQNFLRNLAELPHSLRTDSQTPTLLKLLYSSYPILSLGNWINLGEEFKNIVIVSDFNWKSDRNSDAGFLLVETKSIKTYPISIDFFKIQSI